MSAFKRLINSSKLRISMALLMTLATGVKLESTIREMRLNKKHNITIMQIDDPVNIMILNVGGAKFDDKYYQTSSQLYVDWDNLAPRHPTVISRNVNHMIAQIKSEDPDIVMMQEVPRTFPKTTTVNVFRRFEDNINYRLSYVGNVDVLRLVEKGNVTAYRNSSNHFNKRSPYRLEGFLNNTFTSNRSTLVSRFSLDDTDANLVTYNTHLPSFAKNIDAKYTQWSAILRHAEREFKRGNYVVIGGDFNTVLDAIGKTGVNHFVRHLDEDVRHMFNQPVPWKVAVPDQATARSLFYPAYSEDNNWTTIDGFIVSPNVEILSTRTLTNEYGQPDFRASDHAPVVLEVQLGKSRAR